MKCFCHAFSTMLVATLVLSAMLATANAQVAFTFSTSDLNTVCANNVELGLDYCIYLVSNLAIDVSPGAGVLTYPDGPLNNFVCARTGLADLTLENPRDNVPTTNTTSVGFFLQAPCDCTSITWTFANATLVIANNNANAVLNSCGACGPATGNTACETLDDSACYKAGFCSAGVCTHESNCVPTEANSTSTCNADGDACVETPCADKPLECLTATFDDDAKTCTYTVTGNCTPGSGPAPVDPEAPAPTPTTPGFNDPGKGGNWGLTFQIGFPFIFTAIIIAVGLNCVTRTFVGIRS